MASIFQEFAFTYRRFARELPNHPLTEEIRRVICRSTPPDEQWVRKQTEKMKDLIEPFWLRSGDDQSVLIDEGKAAL